MTTKTQTPTTPMTRPTAASPAPRDVRRTRRLLAAALLPVPAVAVAVLRLVWPAFSAPDTAGTLAAIAKHPAAQEAVIWLGMVMALTMVPAVLAAARLARRRRPTLAMIAAGVNLIAYLGAAPLFAGDLMAQVAARPEFDQARLAPYLDAVSAHPASIVGSGAFVLGHILGMILLGAALWRARVIPPWGGLLLALSQPVHLVAAIILPSRALDVIGGWGMTTVGFTLVSLAILRMRDDDWDQAPARP
jgi:hypothetical protein